MTYTKAKDGRLYRWIRIEPGPKGRRQAWGQTPQDVERRALEILSEAEETKRAQSVPIAKATEDDEPGSFAEFFYSVYSKRAYAGARHTTVVLYDYYFRQHILPAFGHLQMSAIGYQEMMRLEASLSRKTGAKTKKPLSDKTKREVIMRAREIMDLYVQMERAEGRTPKEGWRLHKPPKATKKKKREEVEADYSVRLLEAAKGTYLEGPLYCILFLAMRRGEVAAMTTRSLDRKHLRIRVLETAHALLPDGSTPKGDKTRDIPVPKEIMDVIDRLRDRDSVRLWTREFKPGHKAPIHPDTLSHDIPDFCVRNGLPRKTAHELRSLAATNLLAIGASPVLVMEILGHVSLQTSLIYFDPRAEEKRAALSKLFGA